MKKITLLAFILATFLTNAQIILSEDFEGGIPSSWSNTNAGVDPLEIFTINNTGDAIGFGPGNGYLYAGVGIAMSGNYAEINSDANLSNGAEDISLVSPAMDLSSMSTIKLSFESFMRGGFGEVITIEVSADGGTTWDVIDTITGTGTTNDYAFGSQLYDISSNVAGSSTAHVKFRWQGDFSWGWSFDNIIVQQPQGSAPFAVTDMIPADGATDVEIMSDGALEPSKMIEFSWTESLIGDPATSFDISIGTDVTFSLGTITDVVSGGGILYGGDTSGGWMPNTTYYWKVTANNVAGSTDSPVHVFTTGANDPLGLEAVEATTFKAFPNPVINILNIEGNTPIDSVEIVNQLGQSVLEVDINSMFNNQINLSKLNTGIYFVKVKSASKTQTLQILKQ
jgi:hypothetical protein